MKRSNRLVLLVGVFLAIVAFVGILLLAAAAPTDSDRRRRPDDRPGRRRPADIPLVTTIRAEGRRPRAQVRPRSRAGAFTDPSQVIGQIARQPITTGAQLTATDFGDVRRPARSRLDSPAGLRAIAVQVDQITGVGTLIKTGDYVDMVIGFTGDKFPVVDGRARPTSRSPSSPA